ncbi:hypothetical protein BX666DRAFT_1928151, partial [Dichotomocladium elegans]
MALVLFLFLYMYSLIILRRILYIFMAFISSFSFFPLRSSYILFVDISILYTYIISQSPCFFLLFLDKRNACNGWPLVQKKNHFFVI